MKKIAYKMNTESDNPNLPNGFIIDHFETDENIVEGYIVVDKQIFSQLFQNNVNLMRSHESKVGIVGAHPELPEFPRRSNREAEPVDQSLMTERKRLAEEAMNKEKQDLELFQQFLAWKKSQENSNS